MGAKRVCPACGKTFDLSAESHDVYVEMDLEKAVEYLCHVVECIAKNVKPKARA
jgi:phage terminase large subunit GpA-like protein